MTDTTPDETTRLARRLTPSQRTLAVLVCVTLLVAPVGVVLAQETEQPAVVWTNNAGSPAFDLASDGSNVAATYGLDDEQTRLINNSGGSEWTTAHSGHGGDEDGGAVAIDDSWVYSGVNPGGDKYLVRFAKSSGSVDWENEIQVDVGGGAAINAMVSDDSRLYVSVNNGGIGVFSKADGSLIFNVTGVSPQGIALSPDASTMYVTDSTDQVIAYSASTGTKQWNTSLDADQVKNVHAGPNGDLVYVASQNPSNTPNAPDVFAVDAGTGSVQWTKQAATDTSGPVDRPIETSIDGETVFVGSEGDDEVHVLASSNGLTDTVWNVTGPRALEMNPSGGILYASQGGTEDNVIAIDTGGGRELSGKVTDQRNQAVDGVTIIANGTEEDDSTTTDEDGTYSLTLLNGTYDVTAEKEGYISDNATVTVTSDTTQDFTLIEEGAALSVQARHFMEHGERTPYSVRYGEIDSSGNFVRSDVTNSTVATSNNSSVVTANTITKELEATENNKVNARTHVTFNYTNADGETFSRQHNVTVANATVENLAILPPVTRFTATLGDKVMQTILIATGVAVVAAILAGAFSGIAAFTVIMCMGWVMRIVPDGTIIVVVLTAAFIGMNVAGNVDYTVRR